MKLINIFAVGLIVAMFPFMALADFNNFYPSFKDKDITINPPEGFHEVVNSSGFGFVAMFVNPRFMFSEENMEKSYNISLHPAVFESEDGNALLLYPWLGSLDYSTLPPHELKLVAEDENFDTRNRIRKIFGKDMSQYCNADTAYVYSFDLGEPFRGKFSHCIGIVLRKYAHDAMAMKVLTTDEGKPNAEKYMRTLLNSIRYGDTQTKEGIRQEEEAIEMAKRHTRCPHVDDPNYKRSVNENWIILLEKQRQ